MMTYRHNNMSRLIVLALVLAAGLLAGCVRDVPEIKEEKAEITFNANVSGMREGAPLRAMTYDNVGNLQAEGHFTCVAYEANSNPLEAYISTTRVDWNSTQWVFNNGDDHYYWPLPATNGGEWPSLDFFGYVPATRPSYIAANPTYTADHDVTFSCSSLPMTYNSADPTAGQGSSLKEFMFGMALNQNYGNAAAGVPLQFQHPFTRVKLQLTASHPNITINSITFKSIKNNGSFIYDHSEGTSTWTPSGEATDFALTLTGDAAIFNNNPASPRQIGVDYIMIPQNWTGVIVVDAYCLFWGDMVRYSDLTTTVPTNWQPGYSYTYTFNISPDDLKVNIEQFTEQW